MKNIIALGLMLSGVFVALSQQKQDLDRKAILSMCGCYEVGFNFAETFRYSKDSLYQPSPIKQVSATEYVQLIENTTDKVVMQHLLVVGPPNQKQVIKHWRQDWLYENTNLYVYDHENRWKYVEHSPQEVKGQWTQKVFQVDDSPRYEGSSTWTHVDGRSIWLNTTDAPLPRREHTIRDDYNVTIRTNQIIVFDDHWVHDQDNDKIIRERGSSDILLAQEKGYNVYKKVDDQKCQPAIDWWSEHHEHWASVRKDWDELFALKEAIEL